MSRKDPEAKVVGKLRYRGGLELTSPDADFGGLSALIVSADGSRFVSISDESHWVTGKLTYERGNLAAVTGDTIAPLLDLQGHALRGKAGDAEGMAPASESGIDGDIFVSFEGNHRVWRYPYGRKGVLAVPTNLPLPHGVSEAPANGGLEGLARIRDGMLFAVSEHFRNDAGNFRAWFVPYRPNGATAGPPLPRAVETAMKPVPPFSMTDVRVLPGGDVLTLERRFDTTHGIGVELRRVPSATIDAALGGDPKPIDGEIVASLDEDYEIDNMEGLAVRIGSYGETLLYVVSDDNFNMPMQRTLLMMYELRP